MWLIKAHTSQEAPTSTSGSSSRSLKIIEPGKYTAETLAGNLEIIYGCCILTKSKK